MIKFIKQNFETIIAIAIFSIIILLKSKSIIDERLLIGLLGAIATLYFGTIKFKIEKDKLFKELFNAFNKKYDSNFNNLLNKLRDDSDKELDLDEINQIIDYFNLCAEEYLWRSRNRIPKNVWDAWKSGIKENLEIKQIYEIYQKEILTKNGRKSYYGLVEELKITNNNNIDRIKD